MYKTLYIENTFTAGKALGSLSALLTNQLAGTIEVKNIEGDKVEVEIMCYNSLVMSYIEDQLAPYV